MKHKPIKKVWALLLLIFIFFISVCINQTGENHEAQDLKKVIACFKKLNRSTEWRLTDTVRLNFRTYHPQGMVRIGNDYYMSSVEQVERPERFNTLQDGYDRTPGKGVGHLFHFNQEGDLISQILLGEGDIYHPGGIDYDGEFIWVPVAEYRPNSRSIIYRVNPVTLESLEIFRFQDHIGGIIHNTSNHTLCGVSWGSRRFYVWELDSGNGSANPSALPRYDMKLNGNHYIDYQDCHYLTDQLMICSGLNKYAIPNMGDIALGGLDLVNLDLLVAVHQVPFVVWIKPDLVMNNNPFFFELVDEHLRFYFVPEDDESNLYIYDAINVE
ncbi:hypothetical protein JW824_13230 [bacterium]|nr:hypothetical protein [bacterium]RQV93803.1 MAG: hypothetical protein EH221_09020 [bacterium]